MQNSFKAMYEEDAKVFEELHQEDVKRNVTKTLGIFKFIGEVVEIYLSRVVDIFCIAMNDDTKPKS